MNKLKVLVMCFFAALCSGYVFGAFGWSIARGAERKASPQVVEKGRAAYTTNCARCHGGDGLGHTKLGEMLEAPDLTDAAFQKSRSDGRIKNSIKHGRGQMPAFDKKLSKDEIAAVIAYVRTLKR